MPKAYDRNASLRLRQLCLDFINDHRIKSWKDITGIYEDQYMEFVEGICEIVGYMTDEDDEF
jgi:hypothetical protein